MTRRSYAAACLAAALVCIAVPRADAQDSRAEQLRKRRVEKAKLVAPYHAGLLERLSAFAGEKESGGRPLGWYPYLGSIFPGGAIALGAGYRFPFRDTGQLEIEAAASYRRYKKLDVTFDLPRLAGDRLLVRTRGLFIDATSVNFFGVGNDTEAEAKTTYRFSPLTVRTTAAFDATRWLQVGGSVDYIRQELGKGRTAPSIEEVYTPATAPGLGAEPDFLVGSAFAAVDTRPARGYSTSGGHYRADLLYFSDRDGGRYSFRRFDAQASQLFPILRANWVIALRGLVTMTGVDSGNQVPHFLLPSLGHSRDLRGFQNFRFRDRHRLVLTAEYRWTPSRVADMLLFVDAGKVAADRGDLDLSDLHKDYGIGLRFHTLADTILRFEYARSAEGGRFIFGVGPNF